LRYRGCVFAVPLHPQHQRLEAAHGQVGVERPRHRAGAVLQETERRIQLLVAGDQRAADDVGVPADVLRGRVEHDVSAEVQRLLQCR
jgi:hypothetical protein